MSRLMPLVLSGMTLAGCALTGDAPTPPVRPGPSEISAIGIITGASQRDWTTTYTLADGREVVVDASAVREVHKGGGETLLVVGKDIQGPWWAEIGVQDGMPAGCHVMNEAGADWGSFIEIAGVAWPKAIGFASETGPVPLGGRYPGGTRFCLDADARVYLATNRQ